MEENSQIIDKILAGLEISFQKLVDQKAVNDEELIFADEDGNIVRVKAKELQKQRIAAAENRGENKA